MNLRILTIPLALPFFLFGFQSFGQGLPSNFNFDGILTDDFGQPLEGPANLSFEIYNPAADCLLYAESHTLSLEQGHFSVKIGTGTRVSGSIDGGAPFKDIFQNSTSVRSATPTYCTSGYFPSAGDSRKLKVIVNGNPLSPFYDLSSVPMATVAETLQGKEPGDFVRATGSTPQEMTNKLILADGLSLKSGAQHLSLSAPPTLASDITFTLPGDLGSPGMVLTTDGSGHLSWNTAGGGGVGTVTSVNTGTGLTGGPITASGTISIADGGVGYNQLDNSGVTAGTYGSATHVPVLSVDTKGRVIDVSTTTISGVDPSGSFLENGKVWIGDGANTASATAISGDATLSNSGILTIANNAITDAKIAGGISASKLTGTLPAINGAALNSLNATNISAGTLSAARLPTSVVLNDGNTGTLTIGTNNATNLSLETNNTTRMTVTPVGNIGVGTTTPAAKLHVAGGAVVGGHYENAGATTIDWNKGNVQTASQCGDFALQNMHEGGVYRLIILSTPNPTACVFSADGRTFHFSGGGAPGAGTMGSNPTMYIFTASSNVIIAEKINTNSP